MYVVTVTFRIAPGHEGEFLSAIRHNAARSLREEPGCRQFDVCTTADRPGEVFLYELYDDQAAFAAHLGSDHYKLFADASAPMVAEKLVRTYALQPAEG